MMSFDGFITLFCFSGGAWGLITFGLALYLMGFVVRRYEEETDLMASIYFKKHVLYPRYIPSFWSSMVYLSHYWICRYFWILFNNTKPFRDITDPNDIIKHFSNQERKLMDFMLFALVLTNIHLAGVLFFNYFWPEAF